MANKLDYRDEKIEQFAIEKLTFAYNSIYNDFIWNQKADDFDFIHQNLGIALEVSVIITKNTQNVLSYQNSFRKNIATIKQAKVDENGRLVSWYGGSVGELRRLIIERINRKNAKAKKHLREEIVECQLCLCIDDGGWFERKEEFDFLKEITLLKDTVFNKIFIITSSLFLVYENNEIASY
jgi:hypothetical protein